jgi:hypothetical protein
MARKPKPADVKAKALELAAAGKHKEAAEIAGVTPRTVREWAAAARDAAVLTPIPSPVATGPNPAAAARAAMGPPPPETGAPPRPPGAPVIDTEKIAKGLMFLQRATVRSAAYGAAIACRLPLTDPFVVENAQITEAEETTNKELAPYAAEYAPWLARYLGPILALGFLGTTLASVGARVVATARYARVYHSRDEQDPAGGGTDPVHGAPQNGENVPRVNSCGTIRG